MGSSDSGGIEIDVIVHAHGLETVLIERHVEDRALLLFIEAAREIGAELLDEKRDAFGASALMPDRIFDDDLGERGAILEQHAEAVGDRALVGIVIVARELRILDAGDLL